MFKLTLSGSDGFTRSASYNPHRSILCWADTGELISLESVGQEYRTVVDTSEPYFPLSPTNPRGKNRDVKRLKIQLGFKCNFSCEYCNQASTENSEDGNPKAVEHYLKTLDTWLIGSPKRIELWGGEPLLYWKSLQPLARGLRARFPDTQLLMITNGSLLDDAKIAFIEEVDLCIAISHDGPGQPVRGPDPLESKALPFIQKLYALRKPVGKIAFNCVLTKDNLSISKIRQHIADKMGLNEHGVSLTTEELFTPYEESVSHLGPDTDIEHEDVLHKLFWESAVKGSMPSVHSKLKSFFDGLAVAKSSASLGQKCSADDPSNLSMDLYGNVLTCQNTTATDAKHNIGNVSDFENIKLNSSTHWSQREECPNCPVLQICRGSCMFTTGDVWTMGCNSSYTYNMSVLASALYFLTGYVLTEITSMSPFGIRNMGKLTQKVLDVDDISSGRIWDRFTEKPVKKVINIHSI